MFLALFQHLRQRKPRTNLKGWVFRVAHNLALKQRTRNGRTREIASAGRRSMEHLAQNRIPKSTLPEHSVERGCSRCVETLPETDRCCLYLRAEGLRYRQIAEVLEISLGGVSLALGRALARLSQVDGC